MTDFDLQMSVAKLAEALLPDDEIRQQKANAVAIAKDGGVSSRSLVRSLPWYRADISIPGAAVAGSGVARVPFPQGATLRHISIFAGTAPGSGSYHIRVNAGSEQESFSLQPGASAGMNGFRMTVDPGIWVVIDVTQAGSAEDITITLHYSPLSGGS